MQSSFFSIETMRKALLAHRKTQDVIGHNIANANTQGYSRQEVRLSTTSPVSFPGWNRDGTVGQMGTGVTVTEIMRIRDVYLDKQFRIGNAIEGKSAVEKDILRQIENAFLEPTTGVGLNEAMSNFFEAFQELSKRPDNIAVRHNVKSNAEAMLDTIHSIDQTLRDIRDSLDQAISENVVEANRLLSAIGQLNHVISQSFAVGDTPNDLMDQRDVLIDELSHILDVTTLDDTGGAVRLMSGTRLLIDHDHAFLLTNEAAYDHPSQSTKTPMFRDVSSDDYKMLLNMSGGELRGMLNSRDVYTVQALDDFNIMVQSLINEVNAVHAKGFGQALPSVPGVAVDVASTLTGIGAGSITLQAGLSATGSGFSTGDTIRIEDGEGNYIVTTIVDFQSSGNPGGVTNDMIRFSPVEVRENYQGMFNVDQGSLFVTKLEDQSRLFFTSNQVLPGSYKGDHKPDYTATMTSALLLPQSVSLETTIGEIRDLYGFGDLPSAQDMGIDSLGTNSFRNPSVTLDKSGSFVEYDDNLTLGGFIGRINSTGLAAADGNSLQLTYDTSNHRLVLSGPTQRALSELGGQEGSNGDIFRILGFEGYSLTGGALPAGTTLTTKLTDLGISEGWIQIDGVNLQVYAPNDATIADPTLQEFINRVNREIMGTTALASTTDSSPGSPNMTKYTRLVFDEQTSRLSVVSDHQFSVRQTNTLPTVANQSFNHSNALQIFGLQRDIAITEMSSVQNKASIVSSDAAARVRINADILNNVNNIAAAINQAGVPGDGEIALRIAEVQNNLYLNDLRGGGTLAEPTHSINDFFGSLIGQIGTASQKAITDTEVAERYVEFYENRREEVSGVSIDEELTKMIQSQQAFNAASRMVTTIDEMLDKIINGMGLVGR